jgi:ribonuclease P protein component
VKRLLREFFRRNRTLFPSGKDVVVIAKPQAGRLAYANVADELTRALKRCIP